MIVLLHGLGVQQNFSLLNYFSGEYYVYTQQRTGVDSINLGFCYMSTEQNVDVKLGESIKVYNIEPVAAIKTLNARIVKTETLSNGTNIFYAYTNLIKECVNVDGHKVNLQVAHNDKYTIIGWPLIIGSC